jgi:phospholipid/cholesterol/gamma-HCH transport system permease protein
VKAKLQEWTKAALLEVQEYVKLIGQSGRSLVSPPIYYRDIIEQFDAIGIGSLTVVLLTGLFTGMVLALYSGV